MVVLGSLLASQSSAKEWARKMFSNTSHDFGTVARAANEEVVFELQNIYEEDIHIASVRASCGCAIPSIDKKVLKTWEKGGIRVKFNTRSFLGHRSATITAVIEKPFYAEVQMRIKGHIRGDVVFNPGSVNFGSVDQSSPVSKTVNVSYAGRSNWQIIDVQSANPNLQVQLNETKRSGGQVGYQLQVQLKEGQSPGHFTDQMVLVTNDGNSKRIPIKIEGNIVSALQIPQSVSLGVVKPGQTVTRKVVVRGKKPFRITNVKFKDKGNFDVSLKDEATKTHLVPVKFTANSNGEVTEKIEIETDLGKGTRGSFVVTATVRE